MAARGAQTYFIHLDKKSRRDGKGETVTYSVTQPIQPMRNEGDWFTQPVEELQEGLEAPSGVEPLHRSFADCSLNHLGTAP